MWAAASGGFSGFESDVRTQAVKGILSGLIFRRQTAKGLIALPKTL
jgi:hypothetical protein